MIFAVMIGHIGENIKNQYTHDITILVTAEMMVGIEGLAVKSYLIQSIALGMETSIPVTITIPELEPL